VLPKERQMTVSASVYGAVVLELRFE